MNFHCKSITERSSSIFFDDATSALDSISEQLIQDAMDTLMKFVQRFLLLTDYQQFNQSMKF